MSFEYNCWKQVMSSHWFQRHYENTIKSPPSNTEHWQQIKTPFIIVAVFWSIGNNYAFKFPSDQVFAFVSEAFQCFESAQPSGARHVVCWIWRCPYLSHPVNLLRTALVWLRYETLSQEAAGSVRVIFTVCWSLKSRWWIVCPNTSTVHPHAHIWTKN